MVLAPGVLDLPERGAPGVVQAHALQHHGVGHERLAKVQALRLVERALHGKAQEAVHVERRRVHDALVSKVALGHVAAKPHGKPVLELGHGKLLEPCGREVKVADATVLDDVSEATHREAPAKGLVGRGRADQRHVVVELHAHGLVEELPGREVARERDLVVLVAKPHVEALWRLAQAGGEQRIDVSHHLLFHGEEVVLVSARSRRLAQALGRRTQVAREVGVHLAGVLGAGRLGHRLLGNDAILLDEALEHVPLTAVANGIGKQVRHQTTGEGLVEGVEDVLEEPIALLELVEEEGVGLRELEGLELIELDRAEAHGVQACEHPAAAGAFLVGALPLRDLDVKLQRVLRDALGDAGGLAQAHRAHGVLRDDVRPLRGKRLPRSREVLGGDASLIVHESPFTAIGSLSNLSSIARWCGCGCGCPAARGVTSCPQIPAHLALLRTASRYTGFRCRPGPDVPAFLRKGCR